MTNQQRTHKKKNGPNRKFQKVDKKKNKSKTTNDWISSLVVQVATTTESSSSSSSLNHNVENSNSEKATSEFSSNFSITKEERIRRRNAKKRRRDDRKIIQKIATGNKDRPPAVPMMQIGGGEGSNSKKSLLQLSETMSDVVSTIHPTMNVFHNHRKNSLLLKSQYVADDESKKRGKATVGGGRMSDDIVQPRNRDYGGLGLARPSLLLLLTDPSFIPKLEEEFSERTYCACFFVYLRGIDLLFILECLAAVE